MCARGEEDGYFQIVSFCVVFADVAVDGGSLGFGDELGRIGGGAYQVVVFLEGFADFVLELDLVHLVIGEVGGLGVGNLNFTCSSLRTNAGWAGFPSLLKTGTVFCMHPRVLTWVILKKPTHNRRGNNRWRCFSRRLLCSWPPE